MTAVTYRSVTIVTFHHRASEAEALKDGVGAIEVIPAVKHPEGMETARISSAVRCPPAVGPHIDIVMSIPLLRRLELHALS